jgi:hypothetical protein
MSVTTDIKLDDLLAGTVDCDYVADGFEAVSHLPPSDQSQRATLRARWVPGPALARTYTVHIDRVVDLIEDFEPVGCQLRLAVGGVMTDQKRVLMAACSYHEVKVTMIIDDPQPEEFGFNARFTTFSAVTRCIVDALTQKGTRSRIVDDAATTQLSYANGLMGFKYDGVDPGIGTQEYGDIENVRSVKLPPGQKQQETMRMLTKTPTSIRLATERRWMLADIEAFVKTARGISYSAQMVRDADVLEDVVAVDCCGELTGNHRPLGRRVLMVALQFTLFSFDVRFDSLEDVPPSFGFDAQEIWLQTKQRKLMTAKDVGDGYNLYRNGMVCQREYVARTSDEAFVTFMDRCCQVPIKYIDCAAMKLNLRRVLTEACGGRPVVADNKEQDIAIRQGLADLGFGSGDVPVFQFSQLWN